nr:immunoglobulin light chain junction region [Macaca mulatta]
EYYCQSCDSSLRGVVF